MLPNGIKSSKTLKINVISNVVPTTIYKICYREVVTPFKSMLCCFVKVGHPWLVYASFFL